VIVKRLNLFVFYRGTVEDTELVDGFVFDQKTSGAGGPNKIEKAKIGLIQFCISPPKTDVSNPNPGRVSGQNCDTCIILRA